MKLSLLPRVLVFAARLGLLRYDVSIAIQNRARLPLAFLLLSHVKLLLSLRLRLIQFAVLASAVVATNLTSTAALTVLVVVTRSIVSATLRGFG